MNSPIKMNFTESQGNLYKNQKEKEKNENTRDEGPRDRFMQFLKWWLLFKFEDRANNH